MRTTTHACLLVLLSSVLLPAARGQEDPARRRYSPEQIELRNYEPKYFHAEELWQTLDSLHGREIAFEDGREVSNLMVLGSNLVIYETPERMAVILDALRQLDGYAEEEAPPELPRLRGEEVGMLFYGPTRMDQEELFNLVWELRGREISVEGRQMENMMMISDGIMIYDSKAQGQAVLEALRSLDERVEPEPEETIELFKYRPRNVSLDSIQGALIPFQRMVREYIGGSLSQSQNIMRVDESGVLVIRETPERIAEIRSLLENLDVAPPQVMLSCYVIQGVNEAVDGDVPAELASNLRKLLPYPSYRLESMGLVRSNAASGKRIRIEMEGHAIEQPAGMPPGAVQGPQLRVRYNLELYIGAFDPGSSSITMDRCEFHLFDPRQGQRTLFSTSMNITGSDYSVLGVAGGEPLFVVLRATPVE